MFGEGEGEMTANHIVRAKVGRLQFGSVNATELSIRFVSKLLNKLSMFRQLLKH